MMLGSSVVTVVPASPAMMRPRSARAPMAGFLPVAFGEAAGRL
jgi:hypothetical protein